MTNCEPTWTRNTKLSNWLSKMPMVLCSILKFWVFMDQEERMKQMGMLERKNWIFFFGRKEKIKSWEVKEGKNYCKLAWVRWRLKMNVAEGSKATRAEKQKRFLAKGSVWILKEARNLGWGNGGEKCVASGHFEGSQNHMTVCAWNLFRVFLFLSMPL